MKIWILGQRRVRSDEMRAVVVGWMVGVFQMKRRMRNLDLHLLLLGQKSLEAEKQKWMLH